MSTVFVTGATGVLGRATVARLVAGGNEVRGVVRGDAKAAGLAEMGAVPVAVDLFDRDAVADVVVDADAVLHLATSIPPLRDARKRSAWTTNDRLRSETTALLVDAALAAGVGTLVAESITFPYADAGDRWIDEDARFHAGPWGSSIGVLEAEVARFRAAGGRGVTLRFGSFVGPAARAVDEALATARLRLAPVPGSPAAHLSAIHTDDAAAAVVAALGAPAGVYNVVDDEPLTRRAHVDAFATAFGLGRLHFVPGRIMRLVGGPAVELLMRSQRVANARFRTATGWAPKYPSARETWRDVAVRRGVAAREEHHDVEA